MNAKVATVMAPTTGYKRAAVNQPRERMDNLSPIAGGPLFGPLSRE